MPWTSADRGFEAGKLLSFPLSDHLNRAVCQIAHRPSKLENLGLAPHENPKAHSLDVPAHDPAESHAGFRNRDFAISTTIGRSDTPMMPMMTKVKLFLTTPRPPKK